MAQPQFRSILVGIEFPQEKRQAGLQRAVQLARRSGARLTLFHSTYSPWSMGPQFYGSNVQTGVRKTLAAQRAALEKLAAPLRRKGIKVSTSVAWDYPAFEAIVRETLRSKPDLVVSESHRRAFGARLLLTNTDWQLIRLCPAPLLFVKQEKAWTRPRVLAAVDPLHMATRTGQLDRRIVENAAALVEAGGGRLDLVHAHLSPLAFAPVSGTMGMPLPPNPAVEAEARRRAQQALDRLARSFEVPADRAHLVPGEATDVLPDMARKLRADLLVMGAVSRRGLDRLFIGSTAERILDKLPCDVLVVKPRGFRTSVSRRYPPQELDVPAF